MAITKAEKWQAGIDILEVVMMVGDLPVSFDLKRKVYWKLKAVTVTI